jgi:uncharacterized protein (TIGR03435 family)
VKFSRPFVLSSLVALSVSLVASSSSSKRQLGETGMPTIQITVPEWQKKAGGKAKFDVASVKPNKSSNEDLHQLAGGFAGADAHTNIAMAGDDRPATGGLFSATNYPLGTYIAFAYKLNAYQTQFMVSHLPKWTTAERFDIEAHARPDATKDQIRLMMQSLLEDRFQLAVHFENRQGPVLALVLVKPGKTGPMLAPHSEDHPCTETAPLPGVAPTPPAKDGFPSICGTTSVKLVSGRMNVKSPNISIGQIASYLLVMGNLDRTLLNQTGLSGNFDFSMEFTPEFNGPPPQNFQPDSSGPTFLEALKDQLGLKLVPQTGPVDVLVIDHVVEPSPN